MIHAYETKNKLFLSGCLHLWSGLMENHCRLTLYNCLADFNWTSPSLLSCLLCRYMWQLLPRLTRWLMLKWCWGLKPENIGKLCYPHAVAATPGWRPPDHLMGSRSQGLRSPIEQYSWRLLAPPLPNKISSSYIQLKAAGCSWGKGSLATELHAQWQE